MNSPGRPDTGVTDHGWRSKLHLNKYHLLLLWIDCQFPDGTHSLLPETHYSCAAIDSNKNNCPGPRGIRSRQISKVIFQQDRFSLVNGIWKVLFFLQGKEILENTFWKLLKNRLWRFPFIRRWNKNTCKLKEGTVPLPPHRPCAWSDDNVLPVQELSHFWGSRSGGGETPVSG